ncbi:hypothetical protein [Thermoplasma volcanium]|uniref:hypothetical protein n=1 Tax=Thermoplasma volcanium TaxID=50339 RepID=UPI00064E1A7F|nr:hypothetical protein [Thermoplasma volcanium]
MSDVVKLRDVADPRGDPIAIGTGILFMLVAMSVQDTIQNIAALIYLGIHGFNLQLFIGQYSKIEFKYSLEFALYLGAVAAVMQETLTYIVVKRDQSATHFTLGWGFQL